MKSRGAQDDRHTKAVNHLWDTLWAPHLPKDPSLIIDAGAANGAFSRRAKDTFPDATVIAIEANPDNIPTLMANCPDCVVMWGAVTVNRGACLTINPQHYGKATIDPHRHYDWKTTEIFSDSEISVPAIHPLVLPTPDLLKLDIEGAEESVIWFCIAPLIFLEWHAKTPSHPLKNRDYPGDLTEVAKYRRNLVLKTGVR